MRIEMLNRIMLFGAFVGVAALSSAENISGTVMDTSQKPVEFANVVLLNPQDSTYITGAYRISTDTFRWKFPNRDFCV